MTVVWTSDAGAGISRLFCKSPTANPAILVARAGRVACFSFLTFFNHSPFCLFFLSYFFFSLGWLLIVASFLIVFLFIVSFSATKGILFVETASRANETV